MFKFRNIFTAKKSSPMSSYIKLLQKAKDENYLIYKKLTPDSYTEGRTVILRSKLQEDTYFFAKIHSVLPDGGITYCPLDTPDKIKYSTDLPSFWEIYTFSFAPLS